MDEKLKNAIALFRYGTLSPLITGQTEFKDPWTYFRNNEGKKFEYIDGTYRTICPSTLDRWYKAYKEKGFDTRHFRRRSGARAPFRDGKRSRNCRFRRVGRLFCEKSEFDIQSFRQAVFLCRQSLFGT